MKTGNKAKILAALKDSYRKKRDKDSCLDEIATASPRNDGVGVGKDSCLDEIKTTSPKSEVALVGDKALACNDEVVVKEEFELVLPKGFDDRYNLGGRPRAFDSPFEMLEKMTAYFKDRFEKEIKYVTKKGEVENIIDPEPVGIGDMCIYLGITNQTLNEYQKKKGFDVIITNAKILCEVDLYKRGVSGKGKAGQFIEFVLKNNFSENWKDVKTTKLEGNIGVNNELPDEVWEVLEAMGIGDD